MLATRKLLMMMTIDLFIAHIVCWCLWTVRAGGTRLECVCLFVCVVMAGFTCGASMSQSVQPHLELEIHDSRFAC